MTSIINSVFLFNSTGLSESTSSAIRARLNEDEISITVQLTMIIIVFIILLGLFLYGMEWWSKHSEPIKNFFGPIKKNYFIILLFFPAFYLIYYYSLYLPNKNNVNGTFWVRQETADYLLRASLTFLGTGVLAGAVKWLNNHAFFKKQFAEIIKSEDFSNVLSEKMKELALSDSYLLQRNDLEEIWKRVTLCKYEQKFPELGPEIQKKIENDLFVEQSLMYYYKNFRLQINLSIEGDIIKIVEITSLSVISATTEKIEINFGTNSPVSDSEGTYAKLIEDQCKCDGKVLKLETLTNVVENGLSNSHETNFAAVLEGKKKYFIERQVELTQDIKNDRVFSFLSTRIIEDISINIKLDENLDIFFSPVGKNSFQIDNHRRSDRSISYITHDLLLPGEKFKVFIFRKNQNNI